MFREGGGAVTYFDNNKVYAWSWLPYYEPLPLAPARTYPEYLLCRSRFRVVDMFVRAYISGSTGYNSQRSPQKKESTWPKQNTKACITQEPSSMLRLPMQTPGVTPIYRTPIFRRGARPSLSPANLHEEPAPRSKIQSTPHWFRGRC